jgi:hypothetical protein
LLPPLQQVPADLFSHRLAEVAEHGGGELGVGAQQFGGGYRPDVREHLSGSFPAVHRLEQGRRGGHGQGHDHPGRDPLVGAVENPQHVGARHLRHHGRGRVRPQVGERALGGRGAQQPEDGGRGGGPGGGDALQQRAGQPGLVVGEDPRGVGGGHREQHGDPSVGPHVLDHLAGVVKPRVAPGRTGPEACPRLVAVRTRRGRDGLPRR